MKILKTLLLALAVFVGLLFVIGFFLPKHTHIERSVVIDAPAGEVYNLVNELKAWEQWSPWYEMEPTATYTYSSPASGAGSWYSWEGEQLGKGKMTITAAQANSHIDAAMEFEGMPGAEADFDFEATGPNQTTVTWHFDTDSPNVMYRWFGVMTDMMLGPQYEQGLANLKRVAES